MPHLTVITPRSTIEELHVVMRTWLTCPCAVDDALVLVVRARNPCVRLDFGRTRYSNLKKFSPELAARDLPSLAQGVTARADVQNTAFDPS